MKVSGSWDWEKMFKFNFVLGVFVVVQRLFGLHFFVTKFTGVRKGVGEVKGFHVIANIPTIQTRLLADSTHELMFGGGIWVFHNICVKVLRPWNSSVQLFMDLVYVHVQLIATGKALAAVLAVVYKGAGKVNAFNVVFCVRLLRINFAAYFTSKLRIAINIYLFYIVNQDSSIISWNKNRMSIKTFLESALFKKVKIV